MASCETFDHYRFAQEANPHEWLMTADNLFGQAVRLYRQKGLQILQLTMEDGRQLRWDAVDRSVFLLGGFALENVIKAFLVYENPQYVADGRLANPLLSHRLVKLAKRSKKIPMPVKSLPILQTFEAGLESWSRYPCATKASQHSRQRWVTPELWHAYCTIMKRYGLKMTQLLEKGWIGPHGAGGVWTINDMNFLDVNSQ